MAVLTCRADCPSTPRRLRWQHDAARLCSGIPNTRERGTAGNVWLIGIRGALIWTDLRHPVESLSRLFGVSYAPAPLADWADRGPTKEQVATPGAPL